MSETTHAVLLFFNIMTRLLIFIIFAASTIQFKLMRKVTVTICGLFSTLFLNAQELQKDTIRLDETVITTSRIIRAPGNITQKVDVISDAVIQEAILGNRNLTEMLMQLPGSSVSVLSRNDANWGSYGALGPKYSTWMLNGLPVDAFVDPQALHYMAIRQIEVQRGPASVLYPNYLSQDFAGSQSPLAGTVNLVLKEKADRNAAMISGSYGTFNTMASDIYLQGTTGPLHAFAGFSFEQSDYTDYGIPGSWLNMIDHPEYRKGKTFMNVNYFAGKDDRHHIGIFGNLGFHSGDAGRPNRGYDHLYEAVNLKYNFRISDALGFHLAGGLRNYNRSWQDDNYSNAMDLSHVSDNGVDQFIIPADISFTWKHFGNSNLVAGYDYQRSAYNTWTDPIAAARVKGNEAISSMSGIYLQEEMYFGKLIARAGIRYSMLSNDIALLGGNPAAVSDQSWNKLLWSAGVKYNVCNAASVFANAGSSFISPGLKSAGGTIPLSQLGVPGRHGQLPNPDLKPESGMGFDLGTDFRFRETAKFTLRGFMNLIDDAIVENVVSTDPSQTQSVNAGEARSQGIEISASLKIRKILSGFVHYTWTGSSIANPYDADQDGNAIPFVPEHSAGAGITAAFPFGLRVSPSFHYHGRIWDSSSKKSRSLFDPYYLLNARASYDIFSNGLQTLEYFITMYNLTNNRFEMPWQFRDTGFSFMTGLRLSL
jgi:iron complex outermembrane recepter protein